MADENALKDVRVSSQQLPMGRFRPGHRIVVTSFTARGTADKEAPPDQVKDLSLRRRCIACCFCRKVRAPTRRIFPGPVQELVGGPPLLLINTTAQRSPRAELHREFARFESQVRKLAREPERTNCRMTTPGVDVPMTLTYVAAICDPTPFWSSRCWVLILVRTRPMTDRVDRPYGADLKSWSSLGTRGPV